MRGRSMADPGTYPGPVGAGRGAYAWEAQRAALGARAAAEQGIMAGCWWRETVCGGGGG